MKILTEKQFEYKLNMARNEIEERYYQKEEQNRLQQQIWDLQRRLDKIEAQMCVSQAVCNECEGKHL